MSVCVVVLLFFRVMAAFVELGSNEMCILY